MAEIELRPFQRTDFARLINWIPSPEFLLQWAGSFFNYPLDKAQLERYLTSVLGDGARRRIYSIVDVETEAIVGHIELNNIDLRNRLATLSRVLVGEPGLRGKGLGAKAVERILEQAFGPLQLNRVDLYVFDFNHAAIRCYEKVGFVKEGHLRETRRFEGSYLSTYVMSVLSAEREARQCSQWNRSAGGDS